MSWTAGFYGAVRIEMLLNLAFILCKPLEASRDHPVFMLCPSSLQKRRGELRLSRRWDGNCAQETVINSIGLRIAQVVGFT